MQTRNAASVLPDPVGAAISVCRPAAISCHPAACGSVGPAGNRPSNQARTAGWNDSSTRSRYLRPLTFLPETGPGAPLPGAGGGSVAVEHFGLVLVPRRGRPVGVEHQGPAPAVDRDLVVVRHEVAHVRVSTRIGGPA